MPTSFLVDFISRWPSCTSSSSCTTGYRRGNLIYTFGMLMVFVNFTFTQGGTPSAGTHKINILTDLAANGALLYFVAYATFASVNLKKIFTIFGWIYGAGCLALLIDSRLLIFNVPLEFILRSAIYFVIGVSCVVGLIKRIPNIFLIITATLFLMLMHVLFGADLFNIWNKNYPTPRVFFLLVGVFTCKGCGKIGNTLES